MYNEFYGFSEKPFSLTPDPHFLYLSSVHKKALAYLLYGLEDRKGFITVTGEVGAGKTTLVRALMHRLSPNTIVSRIVNTTVSALQLLKMIARDFGITITSSAKEDILEILNEFLLEQYSSGYNAVLIIDEAQNLASSTLEEIRLLSNLETEKDKLLQILLVGQPELRVTLAQPELRQLRQRITVNYHIASLESAEVSEYIKHRVNVAGAKNPELFSKRAMEQIAVVSRGIPRVINIICDAALVVGYVEGVEEISLALVDEVLEELNFDSSGDGIISCTDKNKNEKTLYENKEIVVPGNYKQFVEEKTDIEKTDLIRKKVDEINKMIEKLNKKAEELDARSKMIKLKEKELGI